MTTRWTRTESRMLEAVRRWRREVYDDDRQLAEKDRIRRLHELADRFGLPAPEPQPSRQSGTGKERA